MNLRPYQRELVLKARDELRTNKAVAIQLPTGGGKSHIFASITELAFKKGNKVWICVPRNELIWQTSEHLFNRKLPHGIIKAGMNESRAYNIHVISMETIKRRLKDNKIKNFPNAIIFDECHIQLDAQIKIVNQLPTHTKVIGFSATMERLDGRGIGVTYKEDKTYNDGLYNSLIEGPKIKDLIEMNYLSNFRYFCPPLEGLEDLHRKGTEYDANELDALLKRRAVFGKAIEHYKQYANGKKALVFCRSVKASEETAQRFREAGFRFESIDGKMTDKQRKDRINALKDGTLQGLCNCEIATYGLDVPSIEVCIMLRPTLSVALYMQMIGRALRVLAGKTEAIILDHVSNLLTHFHPLQEYDWQFFGVEKKKKKKGQSADTLKLCPKCWMYYTGAICDNCGNQKPKRKPIDMVVVDGRLVEQKGPVPLKDRPYEEKREFNDRISAAIDAFNLAALEGKIHYGPIEDLCKIAESLGYAVLWVYHQLNNLEHAVNVPLLGALAKIKGYKSGWIHFKRMELQKRNRISNWEQAATNQ
jgi:superfamily II DNA or RNA helicase